MHVFMARIAMGNLEDVHYSDLHHSDLHHSDLMCQLVIAKTGILPSQHSGHTFELSASFRTRQGSVSIDSAGRHSLQKE